MHVKNFILMVNVLRFYDLERVLPVISMSDEFLNVTFNEAELGGGTELG